MYSAPLLDKRARIAAKVIAYSSAPHAISNRGGGQHGTVCHTIALDDDA